MGNIKTIYEMKLLLIIICIALFSCKERYMDSERHKEVDSLINKTDSLIGNSVMFFHPYKKLDSLRYYFFGYASKQGELGGFTMTSDKPGIISLEEVKAAIKKQLHPKGRIVILSIYEFANKNDYENFDK